MSATHEAQVRTPRVGWASRILRLVRSTVLALTCSLLLAPVLAPHLGWDVVVVGGGSMRPTFPLGSLLLERSPRPGELRIGTVITFRSANGVRTTHRIVRVRAVGTEVLLQTRGDANEAVDAGVVERVAVSGIVVRAVPMLGFVLLALETRQGLLTLVAVMACLTVLEMLVRAAPQRRAGRRPGHRSPG